LSHDLDGLVQPFVAKAVDDRRNISIIRAGERGSLRSFDDPKDGADEYAVSARNRNANSAARRKTSDLMTLIGRKQPISDASHGLNGIDRKP